ncbi:MAG TPA: mechanosensitive ion channel family protein, partial [Pyrinomonadaceae bacterium]|nr:mechanosensitive ion channel family protein [Pyrinomonadaceae bacterium]
MNFWQHVLTAAGTGQLHWLVVGFTLAALLLYVYVPTERRRIRTAALIFMLSLAGLLASATVLMGEGDQATLGYRWVVGAAQFLASMAVVNLASVLVFNVLLGALRLKPPRIMVDLLIAVVYIVVAVTLLSRSGANLTGVITTSAVITAAIAFSLQDTLGNVMGGVALQMERTICVGDWIRVGDNEGRVKEIRWRQTSIETRNWDTVVIPNSVLMRSQVTLLGHRLGAPRQQRRWVYFTVDFRYAPTDVIAAVEAALCAEPIEHVAREPKPHCLLVNFKESDAYYAARYWLTELNVTDPTDSVVRERIYFALRRAGIPLSIPAYSVFLTEDDETRRERKRKGEIAHRADALSRVELFHSLTDAERAELAGQLSVAPFTRGEAITRQGAQAHWLYVIRRGEVSVRVRLDGSEESEQIATLREGDFFGEMGLMTGAPRAATAIALTDVECYRLNKEGFREILHRRPEIAQDISRIMAERQAQLESL